jgi:hypothetical protein
VGDDSSSSATEQRPIPRDWAHLEDDLSRVPGVKSARVVGDPPTEIHMISDGSRHPKQLGRDAQSLAAAGHGLTIDHRIVSVVELAPTAEGAEEPSRLRPILDWFVTANNRSQGRVDVGLRWNGTQTTGGAPITEDSVLERARASANATLEALKPRADERHARLVLEGVFIQQIGTDDWVTVHVACREGSATTPLVGVAAVRGDITGAAARATLDATNRKVS